MSAPTPTAVFALFSMTVGDTTTVGVGLADGRCSCWPATTAGTLRIPNVTNVTERTSRTAHLLDRSRAGLRGGWMRSLTERPEPESAISLGLPGYRSARM